MDYTASEYCHMLIIYGEWNRNSSVAAREYAARFPARRSPTANIFLRLINQVRKTGYAMPMMKVL